MRLRTAASVLLAPALLALVACGDIDDATTTEVAPVTTTAATATPTLQPEAGQSVATAPPPVVDTARLTTTVAAGPIDKSSAEYTEACAEAHATFPMLNAPSDAEAAQIMLGFIQGGESNWDELTPDEQALTIAAITDAGAGLC